MSNTEVIHRDTYISKFGYTPKWLEWIVDVVNDEYYLDGTISTWGKSNNFVMCNCICLNPEASTPNKNNFDVMAAVISYNISLDIRLTFYSMDVGDDSEGDYNNYIKGIEIDGDQFLDFMTNPTNHSTIVIPQRDDPSGRKNYVMCFDDSVDPNDLDIKILSLYRETKYKNTQSKIKLLRQVKINDLALKHLIDTIAIASFEYFSHF